MSSISSIYSQSNSLSLIDLLTDAKNESSSILDSSTTLSSSNALLSSLQSRRAQNAYGGSAASELGRAALNRALQEMGSNGGPVTFKDIAEYREKLEAEFSARVRTELAEQGLPLETDFTLILTSEGKVQVECADPAAKEVVEQYLADNPELCERFGYIQALSNLERARQSPAGSQTAWQEVRNSKMSYQMEAVEAFFNAALNTGMNYASILAEFSAASDSDDAETDAVFYTGLDFTV